MGNPFILVLLVIGLVICSKGRKRNSDLMFSYGYRFFLLLFCSGLYSLVVPILLTLLIPVTVIQRPELYNVISRVPGIVLSVIAYLFLIIAFSRNIKSEAGKRDLVDGKSE